MLMTYLRRFMIAVVILAAMLSVEARAAEVTIPWGDALYSLSASLVMIALAMLGWAMRQLPAALYALLQRMAVDQLLSRAIESGINGVAGAAKGKVLQIEIANLVLAKALEYAIRNGSPKLVEWMNGPDGVRDKLIARLDVEAKGSLY